MRIQTHSYHFFSFWPPVYKLNLALESPTYLIMPLLHNSLRSLLVTDPFILFLLEISETVITLALPRFLASSSYFFCSRKTALLTLSFTFILVQLFFLGFPPFAFFPGRAPFLASLPPLPPLASLPAAADFFA